MISPALDAEFSLAVEAIHGDAAPRAVAKALQDSWGYSRIAKADPNEPGSHGHPEIARQERAFYDALTSGQKEAYRDLQEMVLHLFRRRKPFDVMDPWKADEPLDAWKRRAFKTLAEQPAKAFMLGQILAAEFLENSKKVRPLMPTDERAIRFLQAYTFSEIDARFDWAKGRLRNALIQGVQEGKNPKQVAAALASELDDFGTNLKVIAITETSRAESQGRLQEIREQGDEFVVGSSAFDSRTCPHCKRLIDEKVHRIADVIGRSNFGRKAAQYLAVIPLHPRCRCVWLPFTGTPAEAKAKMKEQKLALV